MKEFRGKVAVITGGASGIGLGIAERCVQEGMKVVIADINAEDLKKAEAQLKASGGTVISVPTDVAKLSDIENLAAKTLEAFGAVHLLFNNAGVGGPSSPAWETTWKDWEWVMGINLWGVIYGVKIFTPIMLAQNTECHIVNTSSLAGLTGYHPPVSYSVTKHAVVALSENLYVSLAQRNALVKASVLCPNFVKTNIVTHSQKRLDETKDEIPPLSPFEQTFWGIMKAGIEAGISPTVVADQVFSAIREERFYILTGEEGKALVQDRMERILQDRNPLNPFEAPGTP